DVDAASAQTGNANHVAFADSDHLGSPGNRKVSGLGSVNSRNTAERTKSIRFDLGKGAGASEYQTLQSRERTAREDQSVPRVRQLVKLFERSDHFRFAGECCLRHSSVVIVQGRDQMVCQSSAR